MGSKLTKLDLFAVSPKLIFNKQTSFSTNAGLLMTLFVFILTILALRSFSENFLYKRNPFISTMEKTFKEMPIFELSADQFNFAAYFLSDGVRYKMDSSLFRIEAFISKVNLSENNEILEEFIELELEPCTSRHFPSEKYIQDSFYALGIHNSLCLKPSQKNRAVLVGVWGQKQYHTLQILFERCENSTQRFEYENQ